MPKNGKYFCSKACLLEWNCDAADLAEEVFPVRRRPDAAEEEPPAPAQAGGSGGGGTGSSDMAVAAVAGRKKATTIAAGMPRVAGWREKGWPEGGEGRRQLRRH